MKKNHKGSHVGMVLSFLIFIVFLTYLYTTLEPTIKIKKNNQIILENLKLILTEKTSANLTVATVSSSGGTCLEVSSSDIGVSNVNSIVKKRNNEIANSKYSTLTNSLFIENLSETFLKIYYSEEEFKITSSPSTSNCIKPTIESVQTDEYIFETKIFDLINYYNSSYEGLKNNLKIPESTEFNFNFELNNGTILGGTKSVSTDIYADEFHIQYIDKEANILQGVMKIKIW